MSVKAFNWRGQQVDADALMARYAVKISPAGPGPAMRVVALIERYGRALMEVNVPAGNLVRMVIPGEDKAHPTEGGRFTIPMNTGDHTYYPMGSGQGGAKRGPFGFSVAGQPSDYIDGLGIAFGAYDDDPSQLPPASIGNAYGHLEPTFAWDTGVSTPTTPTQPSIPVGGMVLTPEEAFSLRASANNIDSIITTATNRKPA